jgi:hypothetical protein
MGICFHYRGRLNSPESLQPLIEELTDIATVNNWKWFVFDKEFPDNKFTEKPEKVNLYGIAITPPDCEMVSFTFASNGKMCDIISLQSNDHLDDMETYEFFYNLSVKTQYATLEIHKQLILLFDYINSKYLKDLIFHDEAEFWETRDELKLKENFDRNLFFIESFKSTLENVPINEGESPEDYIMRMAEIVKKNNPNE